MTRRRWVGLCALLFVIALVHRLIACGWEPEYGVRFGPVHAHSPLGVLDLDSYDVEPGCFLDANLVQQAYRLESCGRFADALDIDRQIEGDVLAALKYRRAERFLLHPLDVARTRIRVAESPPGEVAPYLAACRDYEEGRLDEARKGLREGGPLAEEWSCLAGLLLLPTDAAGAEACFARAGGSVRARWLLARAQRTRFERTHDRVFLDRALETLTTLAHRPDLGALADDVEAEGGRCHFLLGDLEAAADDYEVLLTRYPHDDMRVEAEESLIHFVYPALVKAGKGSRLPAGVKEYLDGLAPRSSEETLFRSALEKGPAWLKPDAAYRLAARLRLRGKTSGDSAAMLDSLLRIDPDGVFSPLAHYSLGMREAWHAGWEVCSYGDPGDWSGFRSELAPPSLSFEKPPLAEVVVVRPPGVAPRPVPPAPVPVPRPVPPAPAPVPLPVPPAPVPPQPPARPSTRTAAVQAAEQDCWSHLYCVAERFPASEWALSDLCALMEVADKLGKQAEALAAAGRVLRMQPPTARHLLSQNAMEGVRRWIDQGRLTLSDVEKAGILDRYLLESGQPVEMLIRCPDSPLALRALALALRSIELDQDRSTNLEQPGLYSGGRPEYFSKDQAEASAAARRVDCARPVLLAAAERVLHRSQGADPRVLGFLHVQLARARLAAGDLPGVRTDASEALRLVSDARWNAWAWETLARADIALGHLDDAARDVESIARAKPRDRVLQAIQGELGVAFEKAGDRVRAVRTYLGVGWEMDAYFVARVSCTTEELLTLRREVPRDGRISSILWWRYVCEGRWEEADRLGLDIDPTHHETQEDPRSLRALEQAWKWVELSRIPPDPTSASFKEAQRRVVELGDDSCAVREDAMKRLEEIGVPAARAIQDGVASDDAERHQRCLVLLERIPADEAEALYRWARAWYRYGKGDCMEGGGRQSEVPPLSSEERQALLRCCEREEPLVHARKIWRELADLHPASAAAPKALYMAGLAGFKILQFPGMYESCTHDALETARKAFLDLADRYPASPLADDALYWAGDYAKDPAERRRLFERIIREYPHEDVTRMVFPDGNPEPAADRQEAFRRYNLGLREHR